MKRLPKLDKDSEKWECNRITFYAFVHEQEKPDRLEAVNIINTLETTTTKKKTNQKRKKAFLFEVVT